MILTQVVAGEVMGGWLICAINRQVSQTTYLTPRLVSLELLTLTLAFLTTEGIQHIWQISLDSTGKIMDAYLM
jgi:drug/metabolite transporter superfamily protein YnfA